MRLYCLFRGHRWVQIVFPGGPKLNPFTLTYCDCCGKVK